MDLDFDCVIGEYFILPFRQYSKTTCGNELVDPPFQIQGPFKFPNGILIFTERIKTRHIIICHLLSCNATELDNFHRRVDNYQQVSSPNNWDGFESYNLTLLFTMHRKELQKSYSRQNNLRSRFLHPKTININEIKY